MSVYAFVQSSKNDGIDFLVKDGVIIENLDDAHKYLNKIDTCFELVSKKDRPTYIENNSQHIFVDFHKEKDTSNRRREFLLCWNSTDSKDKILETARKIGITDEFDYDKLEKEKSNKNIFLFIVIIAIFIILFEIFQK
jgi:hypothetical protein